jgi:hypothetical protein
MAAQATNSYQTRASALPYRIEVLAVVSSRYGAGERLPRPQSWDERHSGIDIVKISTGAEIRLASSAMQSVPKPGWVLMLTAGDENRGYEWTLYGMTRPQ